MYYIYLIKDYFYLINHYFLYLKILYVNIQILYIHIIELIIYIDYDVYITIRIILVLFHELYFYAVILLYCNFSFA